MLIKDQVVVAINNMPEEFGTDDMVEQLMLLDKVEQEMENSEAGRISIDEESAEKLENVLHKKGHINT